MEPQLLTHNEQVMHLEPFINLLVERFQPQQLICFSSIFITEEKSGCFTDDEQNFQHHCCLLLVSDIAGVTSTFVPSVFSKSNSPLN